MVTESVQAFSKRANFEVRHEFGNFNLQVIDDLSECSQQLIPYQRREFYKISLLKGQYNIHYSDKTYTIENYGLLFASPSIPYNWVPKEGMKSGVYCIFTPEFFVGFGNIRKYSIFQERGHSVLEVTREQYLKIENVFAKMNATFVSDYPHKDDLIRNLIFEIIHLATQISPDDTIVEVHRDAAHQLTDRFLKLLDSQFISGNLQNNSSLTTPVQYAEALSVHVNYLNRVLKSTMGKTTSSLIQDRIMTEARVLLKHSDMNISQVAFYLGFKEKTHFSNFFKKGEGISPSSYRKV